MMKELDHISCEKWLRELGPFSLERTQGNISNVYEYLKEGYKEDGASLFFQRKWVPRGNGPGNGHKLKHGRFSQNVRKQFFSGRVSEHWYRLKSLYPWRSSKTVWTQSLVTSSVWPCLSRMVGPDDFQRSLLTQPFCDAVNPKRCKLLNCTLVQLQYFPMSHWKLLGALLDKKQYLKLELEN